MKPRKVSSSILLHSAPILTGRKRFHLAQVHRKGKQIGMERAGLKIAGDRGLGELGAVQKLARVVQIQWSERRAVRR